MDGLFAEGHSQTIVWGQAFLKTVQTGVSLKEVRKEDFTGDGSTPFPYGLFLELSLIQFVINFGVRTFLVQPVVLAVMKRIAEPRKMKYVTKERAVKFSQAMMEFLFYLVFFILGLRVVLSLPWVWPSENWWFEQPDNRHMREDTKFFYILYGARYFQNFVMVFFEPKRKDFWEMQIHHSVTVLLIWMSYVYGWVKVGLIVMLLLDAADPPLHMAKMLVYMKEISPKTNSFCSFATIADIFFGIFALDFTVTRMIMYPYIVWSCTYELYHLRVDANEPFDLIAYMELAGASTIGCILLIIVLQILQIFWFRLLCIAIYKVFSGADLKDERSDSEHSDFEGESKKGK